MTSNQKTDWVCSDNYMTFNGEMSTSMHSLKRCVVEEMISDNIWSLVTLTSDLLNSKPNLFIFFPKCTFTVN